MLSRLFRQFGASCGIVFRTIRAFFSRQVLAVVARVKSVTSLTRQASKLAPAMMKTAATAGKKPTKREDYIETRQMFISKSLLILLAVAVVVLAVVIYLVVWPWLTSRFFTAKLWYQDPDTADYSGKVVIYYDKEKKNVRLEGRLEEGLLQGQGRYYDENGLLIYSGEYMDGVYHGKGSLYEGGTLIYEGEFEEGVYHGKGSLYEEGTLRYKGTFSEGLYDGEGELYTAGQKLLYVGEFFAGLRQGTGTAYENGVRCYKGEFEEDLYSGEGVQYAADGSVMYRGGFSEGLYAGSGTLTLGEGVTLQAEFEAGEILGTAQCFYNGKLYYEGDTEDFQPDGFGTLYDTSGDVVYQGPMKNGSLDGGALLGLSAGELRELLPKGVTETTYEQGFAITSEVLGLTAFCSFAQDGAEPTVYHLFFYGPEGEQALDTLLWASEEDFEAAAMTDEDAPEEGGDGEAVPTFLVELPVELGSVPYCRSYLYESYSLRLWSQGETGSPLLAQWSLAEEMPETGVMVPDSGEEGRLDNLLSRLGLVSEQLDGGSEETQSRNPYYGTGDVCELLRAIPSEEIGAVLQAMLSYLEVAEERFAGEENLTLYQQLLEEEQTLVSTGRGDELTVSQLEETMAALEVQLTENAVQMRKDARTVEQAAGLTLTDYDLSALLTLFDVNELDVEALSQAILTEAEQQALREALSLLEEQENTEEEVPEGATLEEILALLSRNGNELTVELVDLDAVRQDLEDRVMELELAYQSVQLSRQSYETAVARVWKAALEYALGEIARADLLEAQIASNEKRAALYGALTAFTRQAAALNERSGGWLATEYDWLKDVLGA